MLLDIPTISIMKIEYNDKELDGLHGLNTYNSSARYTDPVKGTFYENARADA